MKHFFAVFFLIGAVVCSQSLNAQDDKKDKKKKKKEAVDTTSSGTPAEITIDEPGSTRTKGKTNSNQRTDTTSAPSNNAPGGLERPKAEPAPAPPAEQPKQAEAGTGAAEPEKVEDMEEAPDAPSGAGSLDDNGGSITIDEAGTQKVKKPSEAVNDAFGGAASPTNLTIDEAGTQKTKGSKSTTNLENEKQDGGTDSTSAQSGANTSQPAAKDVIVEEVKEEAKEKAKEEGKEAGKRVLDMIVPKK